MLPDILAIGPGHLAGHGWAALGQAGCRREGAPKPEAHPTGGAPKPRPRCQPASCLSWRAPPQDPRRGPASAARWCRSPLCPTTPAGAGSPAGAGCMPRVRRGQAWLCRGPACEVPGHSAHRRAAPPLPAGALSTGPACSACSPAPSSCHLPAHMSAGCLGPHSHASACPPAVPPAAAVHVIIGLSWYLGASPEQLVSIYHRLYTDVYR